MTPSPALPVRAGSYLPPDRDLVRQSPHKSASVGSHDDSALQPSVASRAPETALASPTNPYPDGDDARRLLRTQKGS